MPVRSRARQAHGAGSRARRTRVRAILAGRHAGPRTPVRKWKQRAESLRGPVEADQPPDGRDLTRILQDVAAGRSRSSDALLPLVYDQLRAIARQRLRGERAQHTLNATALVHEVYMRLAGGADLPWENRAHFFGAAARAMRRILVEHARRRGRVKRGGEHHQVPLSLLDLAADADNDDVLAVDAAVEKLCLRDPCLGEVVHLRFYAGLSVDETAAALGLSDRTVRRHWNLARAWLARELER
jgi:RNA polymerase sigma factor (TIGR02999 family)